LRSTVMEGERKTRQKKRSYVKPRLCRIKISLEESMLTPCKGSSSQYGAPVPAPCNGCGAIGT
jgi:hypothetical protein